MTYRNQKGGNTMNKYTKIQLYAGLVLNVVVISAAAFGAAMYSF